MPVDPNIPLGITPPAQTNPLQMLAGVQSYNTNALQQKVLGAQLQSNQAQSAAVLGATDPTTGQTDWGKAQATLAQDPQNAYNAPAFAQQVQGMKKGQVDLDSATLKLKLDQQNGLRSSIGSLMQDPSFGKADMTPQIGELMLSGIKNGTIPLAMAQQELSNIPTDPAQQAQFIRNHYISSLNGAAQLTAMMPKTSAINTGGSTTLVNQDPLTGAPTIAGSLNNTLSPEQQVARIPTIGPNGAAGSVPQASLAPPNLLPPGSAPAQGGGNGRYPGAGGAASGAPVVPGAAATPGAPAGFLPTSLAPGVAQAADVVGTDSGKQYVADQQANAGSGQRIYQLQSALTGLQGAGSTGPGTATTNQIASFLQAQVPFGLGKLLPGVDPSKIASYDEANKYLTQYASAKASAMGGDTNAKLATTLSGNASTHISGLAAQDVVKANIGLERMGQAQQDAFAASGLPAAQYTTFASKFGSTVDPRVFIADQMEPAKVATLVQKMNPKEQAQFKAQYNWAVQKGYINGPQ